MERETFWWPGNTLTQLAALPTDQMEVKTFAAMTGLASQCSIHATGRCVLFGVTLVRVCASVCFRWWRDMKDAVKRWNRESYKRKQGQQAVTHGGLFIRRWNSCFHQAAITELLTSVFWSLIHLQTPHPPSPALSSATKQDPGSCPMGLGSRGSRGMRNSAASLAAQGFWARWGKLPFRSAWSAPR